MAMRARGGGGAAAPNRGRTGGVRRVLEDFKPMSEWQQDDESHILNIYLPGFMKEQIKVSTEGQNTIRVRGERLVAGNKWSRFQEDFQVPDNGEMNSIRAKFQGGILNITVPKPKELLTPKTPTPQNSQDKLILPQVGTSSSQSKDEKNIEPTPLKPVGTPPRKSQDKLVLPDQVGTSSIPSKSIEPQKKTQSDPRMKQAQDGEEKASPPQVVIGSTTSQSTTDDKSLQLPRTLGEHNNKHVVSERERADDVIKKTGDKEVDKKELPEIETAKKKKMELEKDIAPENKTDESKGKQTIDYGSSTDTMGRYKKAVKGLAELNEERQLLVNMGVAVLVIMALSAYVTYSFASGKDKN